MTNASPAGEPVVPVETISALAAGTYRGADRTALLEAVLRDPVMAAEFRLFRDLAVAAAPAQPAWRSSGFRALALAASIALAISAGLIWKATHRGTTAEPLRGGAAGPALLRPAAGDSLGAGDVLLWHASPGAVRYRVEIADDDGTVALDTTVSDTTATLPATLRLQAGARYIWWVTALEPGGLTRQASPRPAWGRAR